MANHGVFVSEQPTSVSTPLAVQSAIPFVIGVAPVQAAAHPAAVGTPVLCTSYAEAVDKLGYSSDWANYSLCEMMYSHFVLYGMQPVIFCNLLAPDTMNEAVAAADTDVANHKISLPVAAIDSADLVVKPAGGSGTAYVKGTDYAVYYSGENLIIELKSAGACYSATSLNVAYKKVTPASVTAASVATGLEKIELCMTTIGMIPDLILAPGFSGNTTVAAAMATKAAGINGMFPAKALIDIPTDAANGADQYSEVLTLKASNNFTDLNQILCWPLVKHDTKTFHMSTHLAGVIAATDAQYGSPYVSPSNKPMKITALVNAAGNEILLTMAQANVLNAGGVLTALNFMSAWCAWGNYTACYPASTDVKDYFINASRMFDWVARMIIRMFWARIDQPMNRMLIDSVLNSANIWLNGIVGAGYLLGARVEMLEADNPLTNLMSGVIKLHVFITPASPAQEIDFTLEYDASYVSAALN